MIQNRFLKKVFVITGAAGGIGFEVAKRAALEGAQLVLADRKEKLSHEALSYLQSKKAAQPKDTPQPDQKTCPPKLTSAQARAAAATEVSDVILFLASEEASNMTGTTIPVDGGFVCF